MSEEKIKLEGIKCKTPQGIALEIMAGTHDSTLAQAVRIYQGVKGVKGEDVRNHLLSNPDFAEALGNYFFDNDLIKNFTKTEWSGFIDLLKQKKDQSAIEIELDTYIKNELQTINGNVNAILLMSDDLSEKEKNFLKSFSSLTELDACVKELSSNFKRKMSVFRELFVQEKYGYLFYTIVRNKTATLILEFLIKDKFSQSDLKEWLEKPIWKEIFKRLILPMIS